MKPIVRCCAQAAIITALLLRSRAGAGDDRAPVGSSAPIGAKDAVITVVVDNHTSVKEMETVWGFSCMISGFEKTVLFDTGKEGPLLMRNLRRLHIDPRDIDAVVLSHSHRDHTGGLAAFLAASPEVDVYLLSSSPRSLFDTIRKHGATPIPVQGPVEICPGVHTTGAMGKKVAEQALVVHTHPGLIAITGCAHPGILEIAKQARGMFPSAGIHLVMGGFHLQRSRKLEAIASEMKAMGVAHVAPCHCTGSAARRQFRRHFGERFIALGAGVKLVIPGNTGSPCAAPTCVRLP